MGDSNSNIKIDINAAVDGAGFAAGTAQVDKLTASFKKTEAAVDQANKKFDAATASSGKVADAVARNEAVTRKYKQAVEESWAAHERAAEKIYVVNDAYVKAAGGADKAAFATQGARRELMIIGREIVSGDFSRIPGSMMVLASRSNLSAGSLVMLGGALASVAATVGVAGYAFYKGSEELKEMNRALILSGNYSGLTASGMHDLATQIANSSGLTVGSTKEMSIAFASSGKIGAGAFEDVMKASAAYAQSSGMDADKAAEHMLKMFADPAKGAEELNSTMHFLTLAELDRISSLAQSGKATEAQTELAKLLNDELAKHPQTLGSIESALIKAKKTWSEYWDSAMGLASGNESFQVKIDRVRWQIEHASPQNKSRFEAEERRLLNESGMAAANASAEALKKETNAQDQLAMGYAKSNSEIAKKIELENKLKLLKESFIRQETGSQEANILYDAIKKTEADIAKKPKTKKARYFDPEGDVQDKIDAAHQSNRHKWEADQQREYTNAVEESAKIIDKASTSSSEYVKQLQFENSLLGKGALEVQHLTEKNRIHLALEKELLALRNNDKFKSRDTNPEVDAAYQRAVDGAQKAAEAAKSGAEIEIEARDKVTRSWEYGSSEAIRKYNDQVRNSAAQAESLYSKAFKSAEDAVTQFAMTGKLNIRSFGQAVIEEFYRIKVAQPMVSAGAGFLGDLFGGMFGSGSAPTSTGATASSWSSTSMPMLPSYAVGTDYVPRDMIAQIHKGERIIPAAQNNGGGSAPPNIVIQVTNKGQNVSAKQQGGPQFDGRDWVIGVVLEAADNNPHFRNAMGMA